MRWLTGKGRVRTSACALGEGPAAFPLPLWAVGSYRALGSHRALGSPPQLLLASFARPRGRILRGLRAGPAEGRAPLIQGLFPSCRHSSPFSRAVLSLPGPRSPADGEERPRCGAGPPACLLAPGPGGFAPSPVGCAGPDLCRAARPQGVPSAAKGSLWGFFGISVRSTEQTAAPSLWGAGKQQ